MAPLVPELRKQLEKAVIAARALAESGAKNALQALAVHHHEPHGSMTPEQRKLRTRLRAHGRQFGDRRDDKGGQQTARLEREVAYEHWHRMLFARFLAENGFLIEPGNQVPVSLDDVEQLARERSVEPWSMAASFAQRMLPMIFRTDDPVLQVVLPPETLQPLQKLVKDLDAAVFTADDALGWTYQFWQSAEKDAVNKRVKSGAKIDGETLPAVTQLFTEHYMVQFLLHNTLGAWHAGKVLAQLPELAANARDEAELRAAVALPGHPFEYLRFVRENDGAPWRPAAGTFAGWPRTAKELKVLDPCCGSGHFLVAGFELLAALRQHEENLSAKDAGDAVLSSNLFGLELDARCVQIAAFALAMAAWRRSGAVTALPPLQVACCGVGPSGTKEQWLKLAEKAAMAGSIRSKRDLYTKGDAVLSGPVRNALEDLYLLFQKAPELGSLIDPRQSVGALFQDDFAAVAPLFDQVLQSEAADEEAQAQAVAAQGMAKAAAILGQTFTLVATNVPYLGSKSHIGQLKEFAGQHYPDAKANLATVFLQRSFQWLRDGGAVAVVVPQGWRSSKRYRHFREGLLAKRQWLAMAVLGPGAFETIGGEVVNVCLFIASDKQPSPSHCFVGIDVTSARGSSGKSADLSRSSTVSVEPVPAEMGQPARHNQLEQLSHPQARVVLGHGTHFDDVLGDGASSYIGLQTSDNPRFMACVWEIVDRSARWRLFQSPVKEECMFSGRDSILRWSESPTDELHVIGQIKGKEAWGRDGVAVRLMLPLPTTIYEGCIYEQSSAAIVPRDRNDLPALKCFLASEDLEERVGVIDQASKITNKTFESLELDWEHWRAVARIQLPLGLPEPQTNDPTQWLFHGHPAGMTAAGAADTSPLSVADPSLPQHPSLLCRTPNLTDALQVATARLLGYRWPAELDPAMRLDAVQRAWTTRSAELLPFADRDGIVCLNPIRGEASAADRVRALLQAAFGPAWRPDTERKLLAAAAGDDGTPADSLYEWLRDDFFAQHCKLFHDRPFVWHVWDGSKDGFHALVNYHKLAGPNGEGRRTLELLTFTYLNDWIERQRADQRANEPGADARLAKATELQQELKNILAGEPPYDLFVRWKPLHQQPLGWEPDVNDGVRLNIRPFLLAKAVKTKGAGILRTKVGVHWRKDRGKEPEQLRPRAQFPWFWSHDPDLPENQREDYQAPATAAFDGVRHNDLHYTRAAKAKARQEHAEQQGSDTTRKRP